MCLNHKTLSLVLVLFFTMSGFADSRPCEEYYLTVGVDRLGHLHYDLSRNGTIEPPFVDSVCIEKPIEESIEELGYYTYEVVETYYDVQSHPSDDYIDISSFERGNYILAVYVNECVMKRLFVARKNYVTHVECISIRQTNQGKITYYQGILYLSFPDGKCYDVLGRKL